MAYGTAKTLGHDLNQLSISASIMYCTHQTNRKAIAESYQSKEFCPGHPLVLHWDGKHLLDIEQGKESVDRIAVIVSGDGKEKLLGVPKVMARTSKEVARVCFDLVKKYGMDELVRELSFDMTASNTGIHFGARSLTEKGLGRKLVDFVCMALQLAPIFPFFERFQAQWKSIDRSEEQPTILLNYAIRKLREKSVLFVRGMVSTTQKCVHYKEWL